MTASAIRFDHGSWAIAVVESNVRVRRDMQNRDFPVVVLIWLAIVAKCLAGFGRQVDAFPD
jgi:hypothetical protein